MDEKIMESVAASMETQKKLLPFLPYLIQDLWVMGSSIDQILSGIESLDLPVNITVLDLCCGKGGVSVQVAKKFGYKVTGVDAMPVFLDIAHKKAEEYDVSHLSEFIEQDVNNFVKDPHNFDLVILASAGAVFGNIKQTVGILRSQIKKGGYIFIDDGYLRDRSKVLDRKGYEYFLDYQDTKNALLSYGDRMIAEINTNEASISINYEYHRLIEKRGTELILKHPEMEKDIRNYIASQAEECDVLDKEIEGMLWILQKSNV
jgi:ubiquinone/menaquinone biosynthesis C-methylase UbiE